MAETSPDTHPGRALPGSVSHWFIWAGLFLFFAYALSPGPVFKLCGTNPPDALLALYTPLAYLSDHVSPITSFYAWYFGLWGMEF